LELAGSPDLVAYSTTALITHINCSLLPFWAAVPYHSLYNMGITYYPRVTAITNVVVLLIQVLYIQDEQAYRACLYEKFRENFYLVDWDQRLPWFAHYARMEEFPPQLSFTPTQKVSYYEPKPLDAEDLIVKGSFDLPGPTPQNSYYFWFLPTNVPGYVPMRSDENLLAVIEARFLAKPPMRPIPQAINWRALMAGVAEKYPQYPTIDWMTHLYEWIDHFEDTHKRRKYLAALETYKTQGDYAVKEAYKSIKIMVKTDEMLLKSVKGRPAMKPRGIANVSPLVQLELGPIIYEATRRFKTLCSPRNPWRVPSTKFPIYLAYGGASTDEDLSEFISLFLRDKSFHCAYIIVAGDDSLVLERIGDVVRIYEGDAGMFDQSQSIGPLMFQYEVLKRLGMSDYHKERLEKLNRAKYVAISRDKCRKIEIIRNNRPYLDTGSPQTSLGNSVDMGSPWIGALESGDPQNFFRMLGFDMILRVHSQVTEATFLKGMWYPTHNDPVYPYLWAPLPSRFLKLGKSKNDPRSLYKPQLWRKGGLEANFEAAVYLFFNDLSHSYASFGRVPLLRTFVDRFLSGKPQIRSFYEKHKVQATPNQKPALDEFRVIDQLSKHYNVPCEWWYSVENMIPSKPFWFLEHPLFEALAKDYN